MKFAWIFSLLFMTSALWAQPGNGGHRGRAKFGERIEAQKVAFITRELDLTTTESQQFWPIYNEFKEEERKLRRTVDEGMDPASMTEAEADKYLQRIVEFEEKELQLKKSYYQRLRQVLPAKKLARLSEAERNFREYLLREAGERMKRMKDKRN